MNIKKIGAKILENQIKEIKQRIEKSKRQEKEYINLIKKTKEGNSKKQLILYNKLLFNIRDNIILFYEDIERKEKERRSYNV